MCGINTCIYNGLCLQNCDPLALPKKKQKFIEDDCEPVQIEEVDDRNDSLKELVIGQKDGKNKTTSGANLRKNWTS